jgi:hypothetical protein
MSTPLSDDGHMVLTLAPVLPFLMLRDIFVIPPNPLSYYYYDTTDE